MPEDQIEPQKSTPTHRFTAYNVLIIVLINGILFLIGQFIPGPVDEWVLDTLFTLLYIYWGIKPPKTPKK